MFESGLCTKSTIRSSDGTVYVNFSIGLITPFNECERYPSTNRTNSAANFSG